MISKLPAGKRSDAERRARIEFGGHARFKEESRDALGGNLIETLILDARYSLRLLRKSSGFTIAAVLTLAMAIGANTVVFSILNALILRPLDVPHPESLYTIEHRKDISLEFSYPDYLDLRDRNRSFDNLAAYNNSQAGLDTGGNPSRAFVDEVSGNYFDVFGIQPYLGRFFHASDEHGSNSAPYIVLNYAYWHTHFQDDRGAIGLPFNSISTPSQSSVLHGLGSTALWCSSVRICLCRSGMYREWKGETA